MAERKKGPEGSKAKRQESGDSANLDLLPLSGGKLSREQLERNLWSAADILRGSIDSSDYKNFIFGLLFLKRLSDRFAEECEELRKEGVGPEDRDDYRAASIAWVPMEARWHHLKAVAIQSSIGKLGDAATAAHTRGNPMFESDLRNDYTQPSLDKHRLCQIIKVVSEIAIGSAAESARDLLGRDFEHFLSRFGSAEGKSGGQFYKPSHVLRVPVEVLARCKGRVDGPCRGTGGMIVQSERFIEAYAGKLGDLSIYGQDSSCTSPRLLKMKRTIREGLIKDDQRCAFSTPLAGNANFDRVQHFAHRVAPNGLAGFVLARESMFSSQSGEGETSHEMMVEAA